MAPWLLASLGCPLLGMVAIGAFASGQPSRARGIALVTALATALLACGVAAGFPTTGEAYATTDIAWFPNADGLSPLPIRFHVALDGLSVFMYALSALLGVTCVLVSWTAIKDRQPLFYALLLLLVCGMLGVFVAQDLLLFYVFFEFTLIPLFFLIGIWGSEDRRHAASKFFLYTLAGSMLTFLGLLAIVLFYHARTDRWNFSIPELTQQLAAMGDSGMSLNLQLLIFFALFAGFAIKVPVFPLHTWLPLAHVQAPTAGSVVLAGVLLKMGTYGFVRFNLGMLPLASAWATPFILWISVAGIIYGALVALAQKDIKRLIAYSSVSHLGFCMLGLFAANRLGMQGGVLQMVNHGLSTGGLFALVGMLYERYHTRQIEDLGGLAKVVPVLTVCMLVCTFSSIGLPGLNGFVGEFLILLGMFQRGQSTVSWQLSGGQLQLISILAVTGVVLGAWYMLWLVQRVFFGPLKLPEGHGQGDSQAQDTHSQDAHPREILALAPLMVAMLWIGLFPNYFLKRMEPTLNLISSRVERAMERQAALTGPAAAPDAPVPARLPPMGQSTPFRLDRPNSEPPEIGQAQTHVHHAATSVVALPPARGPSALFGPLPE